MAEDLIRYDVLVHNALQDVVRSALKIVAKSGFPGEHHFYVVFNTKAEGVRISDRLKEQYPEEMTIVIQYQFWGLEVFEDRFLIELSFDSIPEKLCIPFNAIKEFTDPSVPFGMKFDSENISEHETSELEDNDHEISSNINNKETSDKDIEDGKDNNTKEDNESSDDINVVNLDSFRKKE